ncbi:MAG: hypothetical protein RR219_05410 [Clostridiales bacterium]
MSNSEKPVVKPLCYGILAVLFLIVDVLFIKYPIPTQAVAGYIYV